MDMLELDGADGGGQLLRTALTLSLCTGTGFTMTNIRGARPRPGLLRQHMAAINAASRIGNARTHGAELGSTALRFEPGSVVPGDYTIELGSAGSTMLVLQTVLPLLWQCDAPSTLRLVGGTHNPMAPSVDFIVDTYLPALQRMGVEARVELECHGFYPAGGGVVHATVQPCANLRPIVMSERGELRAITATALLSALAASIGQRELGVLGKRLSLDESHLSLHSVRPAIGPGNALIVRVEHAHHTETFTGHGERSVSAEQVAERLAEQVSRYLKAPNACVSEHLADQLLLPMALAGSGEFTTHVVSDHLRSNAALIEKFVEVGIGWEELGQRHWGVRVLR
jgi:RNA 3'-terminal phosphate cyclase (ATP)